MFAMSRLVALLGCVALATAHTQIVYPGQRGNNLFTNGTAPQDNPNAMVIDYEGKGVPTFPYGMQFAYPCGGLPQSTNRTKWPYLGGAIAVQPGWFAGHEKALIYINMGIQPKNEPAPPNVSHILVPPFAIKGPTEETYNGTFCLPQVPMPVNVTLEVGDNVTIQVIEATQWGASLYNCVDITLVEPEDAIPVTPQNCFNSSDIGIELFFTATSLTSNAQSLFQSPSLVPIFVAALATIAAAML